MKNKPCPDSDPTSLSRILIQMGFVSEDHLHHVSKELEGIDKTLGEYLVRKNIISEEQLELAMIKQQMLRGKTSHKLIARALVLAQSRQKKMVDSLDQLNKAVLAPRRVAVK